MKHSTAREEEEEEAIIMIMNIIFINFRLSTSIPCQMMIWVVVVVFFFVTIEPYVIRILDAVCRFSLFVFLISLLDVEILCGNNISLDVVFGCDFVDFSGDLLCELIVQQNGIMIGSLEGDGLVHSKDAFHRFNGGGGYERRVLVDEAFFGRHERNWMANCFLNFFFSVKGRVGEGRKEGRNIIQELTAPKIFFVRSILLQIGQICFHCVGSHFVNELVVFG